ncbi:MULTISPECIES: DUF2794 domain-containing protein [Thalassospira]|jgi:hypothetical protein|uniref:DUF2794 domain-containing protein n=5 Tax=Thalassospira TaxID=168934 RepID=A0A285TTD3_9PROT|nr:MULTISPECIES: DUF2794 domain-containing protein [Thalassospira]SOC24398.1 Protein of unknown function [Thalassospira xiamenensis]|tara:strand:+ start:1336 stop:1731 length:396 start_codon:yes stop_codon:yes gene_type:complete
MPEPGLLKLRPEKDMGTLFNLAQYRKAKSFVHFDRTELMQLMNTYSRQVASGAWRDYAIDHLDGMAMFSIFRSSHETAIFTVIKLGADHKNAGHFVALHSGEKIKQSSEIQNVLDAVEKRARKVVPLFKSR